MSKVTGTVEILRIGNVAIPAIIVSVDAGIEIYVHPKYEACLTKGEVTVDIKDIPAKPGQTVDFFFSDDVPEAEQVEDMNAN